MTDINQREPIGNRGAFWRIARVTEETGLSRATIYRLVGRDQFPQRNQLSARAVGWWSDEVERWKRDRSGAALAIAPVGQRGASGGGS